ncbi:hypothetical protein B1810_15835 [Panacagrimonas perspica]|nr:hypothetical protein B1810_15835 [Panacagrimonas perspica]
MHAIAIISLPGPGSTAHMMSCSGMEIPIYALTRDRRVPLCRNDYPIAFVTLRLDKPALFVNPSRAWSNLWSACDSRSSDDHETRLRKTWQHDAMMIVFVGDSPLD